jgi:hypothetical protein
MRLFFPFTRLELAVAETTDPESIMASSSETEVDTDELEGATIFRTVSMLMERFKG